MAKNDLVLDESKPFSLVRGDDTARYLQDGRFFNCFKQYDRDAPKAHLPKKVAPPPAKRQNAREKALAKAAEKLGDLGNGGSPKTIADAARENAAAAAAEDNAE